MKTKTNNFRSFFSPPQYILALWLILSCFSQTKLSGQTYGNVALGGGGFVTGIISHKTLGDIYCRTDVGGAYRWDAASSKWIPLLDWNSENETTYQGVEAIALDPQNANNLYILAGTSYFNGGKTAILKSTDKGNTFTEVVVTSQFTAHGNGMGRSNGERLAVDPNNSNILFCGTRANGLWKSTNGGYSWTQAWNGVTTTTNGNGICFVVFDPSSVSGGVTQTIYIGVSRTGGNNIYKSTNGGSTFTAIQPDTAFMPHRAVLSSDKSTLYVVMANTEGPWNSGSGRVYKLATATGTWTNITPNGNNYPYGGVSVDPANANRIVVSTINAWSNNQFGNCWGDFVFLSADGGSTWTQKLSNTSTLTNNGIGWIAGRGIHWSGSVDFDPLNTARVRIISGNGLFTCDNINASATSWIFDVKGIEETVVLDAISIPGGNFVTAVGDQFGASYSDIYAYPAQVHTPTAGTNNGIAYAANNSNKVVRVSDKIYYSTDQGVTWPQSASINGTYGKVALSADGNTTLHCPDGGSATYYSTNNGATWTSTGVTNVQNAHPIADYVNANKFYIYSPGSGQLLVSTNKGVSFTASSSNPGTGGSLRARAVPGNEGHVWVALANGLKYTTNNGTSWTTVSNVTFCGAVGFGKAATGATYPTVYIWGTVGGVKGLFRSTDQGASWTRINDDAHEWGGVGNGNFVMGDMNVYGRAYMATVGRGLVVVESGVSTVAVTGVTVSPTTASISVGGTSQLTETVAPSNATNKTVSWTSSNTSVATVSSTGLVTGVAVGSAVITVTTQDGGFTATCNITVSAGSVTYITIKNRATGLLIDGMGSTSAGSHCGQYASSGSWNQMWVLETSGSYVYIKNRNTGLYIDGRGVSTNGSYAGQWTSTTSNNLQWQQVTVGGYIKFKNRATGLYLDGMGRTTNGSDLGQWSSSGSRNQQWTITTGVQKAEVTTAIEETGSQIEVYPNPYTSSFNLKVENLNDIVSVSICDLMGKVIKTFDRSAINETMTLGDELKPNIYIIRVTGLDWVKSFKVIKK